MTTLQSPTPAQMATQLHAALVARDMHTVASPAWYAADDHVAETFARLCGSYLTGGAS